MAKIRIDFRRAESLPSKLIEWFGGGPELSHAASLLADGRYIDARDDVLAGVPTGVQFRDPATEPGVVVYQASIEVTQDVYDEWEKNLRAKVTDQYDTDAIKGFIENRPALHTAGRYDCSALAINEVQHVGLVPFPLPVAAHQIDPNMALLIVASARFKIQEFVK
jgi:hypothetical protein